MGKRYEGQNKREKETNEQLSKKRQLRIIACVKLFLINSGEKKSIEKHKHLEVRTIYERIDGFD